ncbi:MAG: alpha/beta hydrolase [Saccharofermentans sp.]|nr:alpha/beta hydrolase [Saccharofermentans sp.]
MIKNGSVKIGNTEMYYAQFGSGSKILIALPGLSDGLATVKGKALVLRASFKRFLKEFTVYMFSRKNNMPEGYTIEQMADDQVVAMKLLGITKASILGVSQGGMISQYIAIKYPEVVDKLVLAVTAPCVSGILREGVTGWIEMVQKDDHTALMVDTAERMYSEKYLSKYSKMFPVLAKFTKPKSYERFLRNANAILEFDVKERLSEIKSKTLIIAGDDDKTVGNDAPYELKNGIKDSELYIYEGLGHGVFEEAKDFYARVYEFVR